MAHVSSQDPGSLLDHYADVIEGGNGWASGTSYYGIPGRYSNTQWLRDGTYDSLTANGDGSTTTIQMSSLVSHPVNRWVRGGQPSYFALCTSADALSTANLNKARRITNWTQGTYKFTTDTWPAVTKSADEYDVLEGFKRIPNTVDINDEEEGTPAGYDRFFDLEFHPGKVLDWFGAGTQTWEGRLVVVLRLLKNARVHDWRKSVGTNLAIIGSALTSNTSGQDLYDGTYTRLLVPPEDPPEIRIDDRAKVVAALSLRIRYRIQRGM